VDYLVSHRQDPDGGSFVIEEGDQRLAELTYRRLGDTRILIDHTFVQPRLRGKGVARRLLDAAVEWARGNGTRISATCSYVLAEFARDRSLADVRD
jgi:predicted GNAT family acetyltransferase